MVDPEKITDYNLTKDELEERILFWVAAAGKNGRTAALNVDKLLRYIEGLLGKKGSPFSLIREVAESYDLPALMKSCGFGCYNIKAKSFIQLANSNMEPAQMMAAGRSEYHPVDPADKTKNRRIEIIISPNLNELFEIISND